MKEKNKNTFLQEKIMKEEGWACFIGIIMIDGKPIRKRIVAHCDGKAIQYYDENTFEPIASQNISSVLAFTFTTSKHIQDVVRIDVFFARSEKIISQNNNLDKIMYYKKKEDKNGPYNF